MKLLHISDLHLGKRLNEYSLLEDQAYILEKILEIVDREAPDGLLIAGDVYDKAVPPAEAVQLFDSFLVSLAGRRVQVFVISGNHDSPERIAFGGRLMDASGIHMSPVYAGRVEPISLEDEFGTVQIYLLPFVKPAQVRHYADTELLSCNEALRYAVQAMKPDMSTRNVLVAHQFVTGARRSESEEISVGGTDNVDASAFQDFDYVALGHIHSPQACGKQTIRYCGTPLKYSFSEAGDQKSVTVVELKEKGSVELRTVPLVPRYDLVELRGSYEELTRRDFYEGTGRQEAYTHITLTDEEDVPDAIGKLRILYHRLMKLDYDNQRTAGQARIEGASEVESKSPLQLFQDFYTLQNNQPMGDEAAAFMEKLIEKVWEEKQ